MRFANSSPPARTFGLGGKLSDWPLAYLFAVLVLPAGLVIALVAVWLGYKSVSPTLNESLEALPMLEAKIQANSMGDTLNQLRRSLFRIAKLPGINAQQLRQNAELLFQDNYALIQEIGYNGPDGNAFLLLRNADEFVELKNGDIPRSPYSPFQQVGTKALQPGSAALYPTVYFDALASPNQDKPGRIPVMRMALQLSEKGEVLVLGINISRWREKLADMMRADSPLRLSSQDGAVQLSFFFDTDGWILFEMQGAGKSFLPDTARQGYTGDLGRAGYDAAFRPWTSHENYWRMVTDAVSGRSGSLPAPADKYAAANMGSTGILCFSPVLFSPFEGQEPLPVGGIAFFETSSLPLSAFLRLANHSLGMVVAAIVVFGLLAFRVSRKLARPFRRMAFELDSMTEKGELAFLSGETDSQEQQKLQAAINSLISTTLITQNDLQRLSREVKHTRARQPVDLIQSIDRPKPEAEFGLVGSGTLMREVRQQVRKAAKAGTDVLIWGETGTGKELVAAAIHKASSRNSGPYISINCGALDENLLLDALFGHVKGAFTEAKTDRKGAFLAANGGTLHLDEIGNASPKVQQALLRALSIRRIRPLGSDKETPFNTRVVAATNVDLRECVREGTFREDLYYRLAIISIETPPLRHRKEDIPELAVFCIGEASQMLGRHEAHLSRGALELMIGYDWPGNVREFKNCLTRALAFVEGDLILPQHITLEQEAFRANNGSRAAESMDAGRPGPGKNGGSANAGNAEDAAKAESRSNGRQQNYAAEYLWPPPPRESFTPARNEAPSPEPRRESGQDQPYSPGHITPPMSTPLPGPYSRSFGMPLAGPEESDAPRNAGRDSSAAPQGYASEDFNERQLLALALIRKQGEITRAQYESVAGRDMSSRTAQNDLRELVERGILMRVGAGPGTRYVLRTGTDHS